MWVNVPNSTFCAAHDDPCSPYGVFDLKNSSTFKKLDYDMNATYASGYLAAGPYGTDTVEIGGATLKDFEFGVAEESQNKCKLLVY